MIVVPSEDVKSLDIVGGTDTKVRHRKVDNSKPLPILVFNKEMEPEKRPEKRVELSPRGKVVKVVKGGKLGKGAQTEVKEESKEEDEKEPRTVAIPGVRVLDDYPGEALKFYQPKRYIKQKPGSHIALESDVAPYNLDSEDEDFMEELKTQDNASITEDDFESAMAAFEKVAYELQAEGCPRPEVAFTGLEETQGSIEEPHCCVCRSEGEGLQTCQDCGVVVHGTCHGVTTGAAVKIKKASPTKTNTKSPGKGKSHRELDEASWTCGPCEARRSSANVRCCMCPKGPEAGVLRLTSDNRWCHVACGRVIPELSLRCVKGRQCITGMSSIPWHKWKQPCTLCDAREGVVVQCSHRGCTREFHMGCAREVGLHVEVHGGYRASAFCAQHTPWPGMSLNPDCLRCPEIDIRFKWPRFPAHRVQDTEFEVVSHIRKMSSFRTASDVSSWQAKLLNVMRDTYRIPTKISTLIYPHWLARRQEHTRGPLLREYDRDRTDEILTRKHRKRQMESNRELAAAAARKSMQSPKSNSEVDSDFEAPTPPSSKRARYSRDLAGGPPRVKAPSLLPIASPGRTSPRGLLSGVADMLSGGFWGGN